MEYIALKKSKENKIKYFSFKKGSETKTCDFEISTNTKLFFKDVLEDPSDCVLGLDPSLTSFGWCVAESPECLLFGSLENTLTGSERIRWLISIIRDILSLHKPKKIVLEDYAFRANGAVYAGELGGILRLLLQEYVDAFPPGAIEFYKVTPQAIKKFIAGGGSKEKNVMLLKLYVKYGIEAVNDDQSDAIGAALLGLSGYTPPEKKPKKRKSKLTD